MSARPHPVVPATEQGEEEENSNSATIIHFPSADSSQSTLSMRDCPKWDACSAPICPLDGEMSLRTHLPGERVCFWLLEYVKPGGGLKIRGVLPGELGSAIESAYPRIIARYGPIRRALRRASKTPPRLGRQPTRKTGEGGAP